MNKLKKYLLLLSCSLITLCIFSYAKDTKFIKLDSPVEDVLSQVTITVPGSKANAKGDPIEIKVGNKKNQYNEQKDKYYYKHFYEGKSEYYIGNNETHAFTYFVHYPYAVETNRYICVPVGYAWGGSGTFYYLTAIDKKTLKSVDQDFLGDRVRVGSSNVIDPKTDTISITYIEREAGGVFPPENKQVKKFTIQPKLQTFRQDKNKNGSATNNEIPEVTEKPVFTRLSLIDKVRKQYEGIEITPDTVIVLRLHNNSARSHIDDDAFPVFDVTLTGPISQVQALTDSYSGTHDGGYRENIIHVYTIPKQFQEDRKIEVERENRFKDQIQKLQVK